ncbi:MAG: hypothetical protein ACK4YP_12985 [Myxococcota bacterium]
MLGLLLACACPDYGDMRVEDPLGIASAEQVTAAERAIADFAAWTTVEGVCVPSVDFVEDVGTEGADGAYVRPRYPIEVEPLPAHHVYDLVLHELCHAWDTDQGRPSEGLPDLFPTTGHDVALAPDAYHQAGESFAEACEGGIATARMEALLAERCDVDLPGAWVSEHVYDADVEAGVDDAPWEVTRETVDLSAAVVGYAIQAGTPRGLWGPSYGGVSLWGPDGYEIESWHVDAGTTLTWWTFGGGTSALLPNFTATEITLYAHDTEWASLATLPTTYGELWVHAASTPDRAWLFDAGDGGTTAWEIALDGSGVVREEEVGDWTGRAAAVGDEVWLLGDGWLLTRKDDGWTPTMRVPNAATASFAPLPDGAFVLAVRAGPDDAPIRTVARFDGARWSLPADPCGADALATPFGVTAAGERVWVVEADGDEDVRASALSWD